MIEAHHISWMVNKAPILADISLKIKPGKLTAIIGPNGSGKSSLIKILSGHTQATDGFVTINEIDLQNWDVKKLGQCRAVLHQETHLDFDFSVEEVVLLGRSPHITQSESKTDLLFTNESIEKLDIKYLHGRPYPPLSGGEKQRVHIARVINQIAGVDQRDKFLLLDEPLNNLDPKHAHEVLVLMKELTSMGVGVGMVIHDLNLAWQYADEVIVLSCGRKIADGCCKKVIPSPQVEKAFQMKIAPVDDDYGKTHVIVQPYSST